jgi:uncharacterized protein YecT (DUF1311 family)
MKVHLIIFTITALLMPQASLADDGTTIANDFMIWDGVPFPTSCEKNQSTINSCAASLWRAADAILNSAYNRQVEDLHFNERDLNTGGEAKRRLVAAQEAWILFRDKDCSYQAVRGGSAAQYEEYKCKYKRTLTRVSELKEYLDCRSNDCPF